MCSPTLLYVYTKDPTKIRPHLDPPKNYITINLSPVIADHT